MALPQDQRPDWYRTSFDEIYPILYAHRTQKEAVEALAHLVKRVGEGGGRILDLGCGAGRHLRALIDLGVGRHGGVPFGLDLSAPLLKIARARAPEIPVVRGDMRSLPWRDGSFRSVLLMFTTFGYFESRGEDARVIDEIARVLAPGGALIFDYVNARHVREHLVAHSGRLIHDMAAEEKRWIDPEGPFLHKETRVGPMRDGKYRTVRERLRLYQPDEIEEILVSRGLRIAERLGDYRGGAFDERISPRLILVAMRDGAGGGKTA